MRSVHPYCGAAFVFGFMGIFHGGLLFSLVFFHTYVGCTSFTVQATIAAEMSWKCGETVKVAQVESMLQCNGSPSKKTRHT